MVELRLCKRWHHRIWPHAILRRIFIQIRVFIHKWLNLLLHVPLPSIHLRVKDLLRVLNPLFIHVWWRLRLDELPILVVLSVRWLKGRVRRLSWHRMASSTNLKVSVGSVSSHLLILLVTRSKLLLCLVKLIVMPIISHYFVWWHMTWGLNYQISTVLECGNFLTFVLALHHFNILIILVMGALKSATTWTSTAKFLLSVTWSQLCRWKWSRNWKISKFLALTRCWSERFGNFLSYIFIVPGFSLVDKRRFMNYLPPLSRCGSGFILLCI